MSSAACMWRRKRGDATVGFIPKLRMHTRKGCLLQAAAPVMREAAKRELDADGAARSRCILNVSSTSGTHGNAGQANYSTVRRWGMGLVRLLTVVTL